MAEHALALILAAWRKVAVYDRDVRADRWALGPSKPMRQLRGARLGLVGFGNIARALARRAEGLGMEVVFTDPAVDAPVDGIAALPVSKEEVLCADVVSLTPPAERRDASHDRRG